MKTQKLFIAAFLIISAGCTLTFGQIPELKKFEFMKGEFKSYGSIHSFNGKFSEEGKEFSWTKKKAINDEYGFITYDEASKSYRLKHMIYQRSQPIYFKGNETSEGFHFYELTAVDGVVKKDGEQLLIRRLEPGFFNIEQFYNYYDKWKPKQWIPTEYYSKNLSKEQLDKQIRKEISKLDFLVGKFTEDGGEGQFTGTLTDEGKKLLLAFTSPEKKSDVVITYDFHWRVFNYNETERLKDGSEIKIQRTGYMRECRSAECDEKRFLDVYARLEGSMTNITYKSPAQDKVLIESMTYAENSPKKIISYSRAK